MAEPLNTNDSEDIELPTDPSSSSSPTVPINIATISSGFEKGDFLVREVKGQRVYFDFFEEAFNYLANKGYSRMPEGERDDWMEAIGMAHNSIVNGTRYNTGHLLMVLRKPVDMNTIYQNTTNQGDNEKTDDDNGLV